MIAATRAAPDRLGTLTALAEIFTSPGRRTAVLVLLVAILAIPSLPTRELLPTDEPRFALVARQMVEDPAPLVPHLGYDALTKRGEVYADKPPVFFWLISFFSLFTGGVNEISARLPSFFAAIAAVLLTRKLGALLVDDLTGFTGSLILATMSQFFQRAFWCSIDMVLTAFVLAATYCWLRAGRLTTPLDASDSSRSAASSAHPMGGPGLSALGGLFAAAATLSKGPVGLIFPLVYVVCDRIAFRADRKGRGLVRVAAVLAAVAAFLVPVGIWMTAAYAVGGPSYLVEILFKQNVTRYVAAWNNIAPWYYYLFRVPLGLFPWTAMLPAGVLAVWSWPAPRARGLRGLLLACALLFVFFSASTGKRGVYLLPLYPAFAILIATAWRTVAPPGPEPDVSGSNAGDVQLVHDNADGGKCRGNGGPARLVKPIVIVARVHVLLLAVGGLAALVVVPWKASHRAPDLMTELLILSTLMAGAGCISAVQFFRGRHWGALGTIVVGVGAIAFIGSILLVPAINRRAGVKSFGPQLAALIGPDDFLVVDAEGYEQILFYSGGRGTRRDFNETNVAVSEDGRVSLQLRSSRSSRREDPLTPSRPVSAHDAAVVTSAKPGPDLTLAETERARRYVEYPPGSRVLFVVKGSNVERLRSALGPSSRTLLAATLYENPYYVVSNR